MGVLSSAVAAIEFLFRKPSRVVIALLLYLPVPFLGTILEPGDYTPILGYSSEAQSTRNTSAVGRLFGEFRTSMSDIMFLKTERYLHSGVGYQPHITEKDLTGDDDGVASGKGIRTLIRVPDDDWRGFVGDLEREIKPWQTPDMHMKHQRGLELLPWFRMMTLVNPHRIRGYRIGAFLLMSSGEQDGLFKARDFLEEGIRFNPKNHELQFMMLRTYQHELIQNRAQKEGWTDADEIPILEKALEYAQRGVEFGAETRPEGGWQGKGRPAEMEDSFAACLHYEIFFLRQLGREQEALKQAISFRERFETDAVIDGEIKELQEKLAPKS